MKILLFVWSCAIAFVSTAQPSFYTVSNAHSHNDYEQKTPFWIAYNAGFGSLEADIFLQGKELIVAHEKKELPMHRTLQAYYLDNLVRCVRKNAGHPYADTTRSLQLLIDIKSDSIQTLRRLGEVLLEYPTLIHNGSIRFVITGRRPPPAEYINYPSFVQFDGILTDHYEKAALSKIAMLSDGFKALSNWNGKGVIPPPEWDNLKRLVDAAHSEGKPVRLWEAPDFINAWYQFMHLGIDYINTDRIDALATFLNGLPRTRHTGAVISDSIYSPGYTFDGADRAVRNIIKARGISGK